MAIQRDHWISLEEYHEIERNSGIKYEYSDGRIYDMSGGSFARSSKPGVGAKHDQVVWHRLGLHFTILQAPDDQSPRNLCVQQHLPGATIHV
jgi:hypothetical protein